MQTRAKSAAALLAVGALSACTPMLLAPDDRGHVCRVSVDDQYGTPTFRKNPLADPATGPVYGAASGVTWGVRGAGPGAVAIVAVGVAVVVGAMGGAACGAATLSHPNAEANFERLLHEAADSGSLKQALTADLDAPRPECARAGTSGSGTAEPDSVVQIENVSVEMACPFGRQEYRIEVKWRVLAASSKKVLGETTTRDTA
jgi:hypothetical protein